MHVVLTKEANSYEHHTTTDDMQAEVELLLNEPDHDEMHVGILVIFSLQLLPLQLL